MTQRRLTDAELETVRLSADEGPLECICDGDAQLCICSLILMACEELKQRRAVNGEIKSAEEKP